MKKVVTRAAVAGLLLSGVAVVGAAGSAQAASGADCISVYGPPGVQDQILLENEWCGATVRVKINEANGPDSPCYTITPGRDVLWTRPWYSFGTYNGLLNC